ncbi:alpha-catulin isoform X2 [Amia ocellicauda]|uniref:alpha-catulin isoform X2 n=1 Tax=Amia ocellicauda TaxID=2972642 RepID=UPI003463FBF2
MFTLSVMYYYCFPEILHLTHAKVPALLQLETYLMGKTCHSFLTNSLLGTCSHSPSATCPCYCVPLEFDRRDRSGNSYPQALQYTRLRTASVDAGTARCPHGARRGSVSSAGARLGGRLRAAVPGSRCSEQCRLCATGWQRSWQTAWTRSVSHRAPRLKRRALRSTSPTLTGAAAVANPFAAGVNGDPQLCFAVLRRRTHLSAGMASSPGGSSTFDSGLEIKTRSVEQTLIPLVSQITTLINHKDKPKKSEKTLRAIQRVGQAVNVAVGRFVTVGEAIATENEELKEEMSFACYEARRAGDTIAQLTDVITSERPESDGKMTIFSDKSGMVKAARMLLSSVTKVLVLADRIVIKQIITSRNKVLATLEQLEKVSSFQEFVQIFSQFGNEMVEFAHLTGDRQNDLKDEKKKARMAAARAVLEKCTMMLLTASKTCLRHPDCESARINKDAVFHRMRFALEQVIEIVTDARTSGEPEIPPVSIYSGIKDFKGKVESLREALYSLSKESLVAMLEGILEHTEDFTDSAYTSHEHRERILELSQLARQELEQLVTVWMQAVSAEGTASIYPQQSYQDKEATEEMELSILKTCQSMNELRRELHNAAVELAADLLKYHADHIVLKALKVSGGEGNLEAVAEYTCKLTEQKEQLVETCRLLRHISGTEPLEITCVHAEDTFQVIGPQIISAAQTLALHPSSKIAKENLDVFCEAWESQLNDMSILLREINDVFEGRRGEKRTYLSLPRPGKHSTNLKAVKAVKLDAEEQTTISKLGLELRLLTSDVDSESEKWEDQDQEIVRQGQSMSSMAYSMYLFTRGEGLLKTTQDLFHQAAVFSEEGFKLCSSLQAFSSQLGDDEKSVIVSETEKLVALCQQLQMMAKAPVHGKNATFQKVDSSIQNTKSIMAVVVHLLPVCNKIIRKYKCEKSNLGSPQSWREKQLPTPVSEDALNGKNANGFGVKSLEHHMANLTFLESK